MTNFRSDIASAENLALPDGRQLFGPETWSNIASSLHLCKRELEIVKCMVDDQKESAIAAELKISPHTVNSYIQRLYHKLNVSSRPQVLVRVFREYLNLQNRNAAGRRPATPSTNARGGRPNGLRPA